MWVRAANKGLSYFRRRRPVLVKTTLTWWIRPVSPRLLLHQSDCKLLLDFVRSAHTYRTSQEPPQIEADGNHDGMSSAGCSRRTNPLWWCARSSLLMIWRQHQPQISFESNSSFRGATGKHVYAADYITADYTQLDYKDSDSLTQCFLP